MNRLHKSQAELATTQRGKSDIFDCMKCGACCFGLAVHLTPREARIFQANRKLKLGPLNENIGHSIAEIAAGIVAGGGLAAAVYFLLRQG